MGSPAVLSVFSGLGGFDLGARITGLDVGLATDRDAEALALLAQPYGTPVLTGDVDELLDGRLLAAWSSPTAPRVLIGGPPCTGFSHAGFWLQDKRDGADPATRLLGSYLEVLRQARPAGFVLENVPGLAFRTYRRFYENLLDGARTEGYAVSTAVLRASDFGVPQARRRLFVVGVRGRRAARLDELPKCPERSARWAIGDLEHRGPCEPDESPPGRYGELLARVPEGENYMCFTERRGHSPGLFEYRGRYWSFLLKIDPDQPAPTLPAQRVTYNGPFHWHNRHLRVREIARLQGFPDWYPLSADLSTARRHLGNAVPPLLAASVLWRLRQALGEVTDADLPPALRVPAEPGATYKDVLAAFPSPTEALPPEHTDGLDDGPNSLRTSLPSSGRPD